MGRRRLSQSNISEAELESELLLRHILGVELADLYLRYDEPISPEDDNAYHGLIERRLAGEPSAYITGKREFYGLTFYVNPSVLIPRPETELLVERTLAIAEGYPCPIIADIGTGSGAIAVAIAKKLPQAKIYAIDISEEALVVAQHNARRHAVKDKLIFLCGNLTAPLPESVDIIAANLPYVNTGDLPETGEPRLALDGGINGIHTIVRLISEAAHRIRPMASILLEIGQGQEAAICHLITLALPEARVMIYRDLAGDPRVIQATLASWL